ncbi:prepilin-type N-terminal cleavage/methylation domain-containing protein [Pseudescherichia vulneris]
MKQSLKKQQGFTLIELMVLSTAKMKYLI